MNDGNTEILRQNKMVLGKKCVILNKILQGVACFLKALSSDISKKNFHQEQHQEIWHNKIFHRDGSNPYTKCFKKRILR